MNGSNSDQLVKKTHKMIANIYVMGGGETFFAEKYFPKGNDSFCLA
jgi:hypothetical protein